MKSIEDYKIGIMNSKTNDDGRVSYCSRDDTETP